MVSPTEGWAVGSAPAQAPGDGNQLVLHYKDGAWQPVDVPSDEDLGNTRQTPMPTIQISMPDANQVSMLSTTDGWMIEQGEALLHYNGKAWQEVRLPAPTVKDAQITLSHLDMLSADEGWAIGAQEDPGCLVTPPPDGGTALCSTPLLLHYEHNVWTIYNR